MSKSPEVCAQSPEQDPKFLSIWLPFLLALETICQPHPIRFPVSEACVHAKWGFSWMFANSWFNQQLRLMLLWCAWLLFPCKSLKTTWWLPLMIKGWGGTWEGDTELGPLHIRGAGKAQGQETPQALGQTMLPLRPSSTRAPDEMMLCMETSQPAWTWGEWDTHWWVSPALLCRPDTWFFEP